MEKYIIIVIIIAIMGLSGCSLNSSSENNQAYADNINKVQKIAVVTQNIAELMAALNKDGVSFNALAASLKVLGYDGFNSLFDIKNEVKNMSNQLLDENIKLQEVEKISSFVNLLLDTVKNTSK